MLSLGLTHSFPLEDVPHFLSSRTVADTLEHAILDAPMFQSRWRWNLNRSLMVLRFRNGRRNPPPIQRMESDDLLAAVFPQAAACQDNIVGPIDIPDHVLFCHTIDDTLHEALDIYGVRLDSTGTVLDPVADPGRIELNGATAPHAAALADGDRISVIDGTDRTEPVTRSRTRLSGTHPGDPERTPTKRAESW